MRLLPKAEINVRQAQQKRAEIDEGVKLAKRVDTLREITAQEEASLASFRHTTLKAIAEEVKKAEAERNQVLKDVTDLRKELSEGTIQLDIRQSDLDTYQKSLEKLEHDLTLRVSALKTLAAKLKEQSKQTKEYNDRLVYAHKVIGEIQKSTDTTYMDARAILQQALERQKNTYTLVDSVENQLRARDIAVASKERDLTIREGHLERKKEELRVKELRLIDREQTLEREIKRLKK